MHEWIALPVQGKMSLQQIRLRRQCEIAELSLQFAQVLTPMTDGVGQLGRVDGRPPGACQFQAASQGSQPEPGANQLAKGRMIGAGKQRFAPIQFGRPLQA
jgi:hypothetical protein